MKEKQKEELFVDVTTSMLQHSNIYREPPHNEILPTENPFKSNFCIRKLSTREPFKYILHL